MTNRETAKHPSHYTAEDVVDLEQRGLELSARLEGSDCDLVRELVDVLTSREAMIWSARGALRVRGKAWQD